MKAVTKTCVTYTAVYRVEIKSEFGLCRKKWSVLNEWLSGRRAFQSFIVPSIVIANTISNPLALFSSKPLRLVYSWNISCIMAESFFYKWSPSTDEWIHERPTKCNHTHSLRLSLRICRCIFTFTDAVVTSLCLPTANSTDQRMSAHRTCMDRDEIKQKKTNK